LNIVFTPAVAVDRHTIHYWATQYTCIVSSKFLQHSKSENAESSLGYLQARLENKIGRKEIEYRDIYLVNFLKQGSK